MTNSETKNFLEDILKKDENGKLILNLTPIKKTAINTKTQKECNELMRVYETGNWKWHDGYSATKLNCWIEHKEETCIGAGVNYLTKDKGIFGFCSKDFYLIGNWKIISTQEFYNIQKITQEILDEINKYFKKKNEINKHRNKSETFK